MCGLNLVAVGKSNGKAIAHRLLFVTRGAEFEAVAGATGIGNDCGRAWGK